MNRRDELIGWMHSFDSKERNDFYLEDLTKMNLILKEFVSVCLLPGYEIVEDLTPDEMYDYLMGVIDSHRAWSQELGRVMVLMDQCIKNDNKKEAINCLTEFVNRCEWVGLREIGESQIDNLNLDFL